MSAPAQERAFIPVVGPGGNEVATLAIWPIPSASRAVDAPLRQVASQSTSLRGAPEWQLMEGASYGYAIRADAVSDLRMEPSEFFEPEDLDGARGRLRPREAVGVAPLSLYCAEELLGSATIEIRSRKLTYDVEFRQMLRDVADSAVESILQGFAPAYGSFGAAGTEDAQTLYRRFAFIAARLQDPQFEAAVARILARPHREWRREVEPRPPGRPQAPSAGLARRLARPGPRTSAAPTAPLPSLPRVIETERSEESYDTLPNRFVKHALLEWRSLAETVASVAESATATGPTRRGQLAANSVIAWADAALGNPLFREVGDLRSLPTGNQVLLKAEGYRDVSQLAALVEAGMRLEPPEGVDAFAASQRSVAALYELWCFLVLADVVGELCGDRTPLLTLFRVSADGMTLGLRAGRESALNWSTSRLGRPLEVSLHFNRTFRSGEGADSSWTGAMRPDCSLRVGSPGPDANRDDFTWVHFDAKYRVDRLRAELLSAGDDDDADRVTDEGARSASRRDDLLKMHAYRDAIRRTSGAYVLYPGDEHPLALKQFDELLPGLGAIALRPGTDSAVGRNDLLQFVGDVLDHLAAQATRHERSRYWQSAVEHGPRLTGRGNVFHPLTARPAADVDVLLGYVKDDAHAGWIMRERLYNVRADQRRGAVSIGSRILGASFLLLYRSRGRPIGLFRPVAGWTAADRHALLRRGYPNPRGDAYLCVSIEEVEPPDWVEELDVRDLGLAPPYGAPRAVTWLDVLSAARRRAAPR